MAQRKRITIKKAVPAAPKVTARGTHVHDLLGIEETDLIERLEENLATDNESDDVDTAQAKPETTPATAAKAEPIRFSMLIVDHICRQIAIGQPLQAICAEPGMPTVTQVQTWLRKYAKCKEMYEEARALQADYLADEMLMLVKEMRNTTQPGRASALRAAADLLAKQAEWRAPRKYGPKMDLNITDRPKTPDEIRAEIARLRSELGVPDGRIARIK